MIAVFIDTNILYSSDNNLTTARFISKLQDIISEIEVNDIYTDVKIIVPKIVIHELYEQQLQLYEEWMHNFSKVNLPNVTINHSFDYEKHLEKLFSQEIDKLMNILVQIEIADFPQNSILPLIINRAIKKRPPFEGKTGKSDNGFKDVVIWETLKSYKNKHINETIVLCCNDNLLSDNNLKIEYEKEFRDTIYFEKKENLMSRLTQLLDKDLVQSFEEQLKQRLQYLLNESNQSFSELLMESIIGRNEEQIIGFLVREFNILCCNDEKIDNKIKYDIELNVLVEYTRQDEKEIYRSYKKANFIIFYNFRQDNFSVKEFDDLYLARHVLFELYNLVE